MESTCSALNNLPYQSRLILMYVVRCTVRDTIACMKVSSYVYLKNIAFEYFDIFKNFHESL